MIFRGESEGGTARGFSQGVYIRRGDPVWNARQENLAATVSQDERGDTELVGLQKLRARHAHLLLT